MGSSDQNTAFTPMLLMFVWESGIEQLKKIFSLLIPVYGITDWILIDPWIFPGYKTSLALKHLHIFYIKSAVWLLILVLIRLGWSYHILYFRAGSSIFKGQQKVSSFHATLYTVHLGDFYVFIIDSFILALLWSIRHWLLPGTVGLFGLAGFANWLNFSFCVSGTNMYWKDAHFPELLLLVQQKENGQCNKGKHWDVVRIFSKIIRGYNSSGKYTCNARKLVMHGKKSFEIQTPVSVTVIARLLEVSGVEHRHILEMGRGLVVVFVF